MGRLPELECIGPIIDRFRHRDLENSARSLTTSTGNGIFFSLPFYAANWSWSQIDQVIPEAQIGYILPFIYSIAEHPVQTLLAGVVLGLGAGVYAHRSCGEVVEIKR